MFYATTHTGYNNLRDIARHVTLKSKMPYKYKFVLTFQDE